MKLVIGSDCAGGDLAHVLKNTNVPFVYAFASGLKKGDFTKTSKPHVLYESPATGRVLPEIDLYYAGFPTRHRKRVIATVRETRPGAFLLEYGGQPSQIPQELEDRYLVSYGTYHSYLGRKRNYAVGMNRAAGETSHSKLRGSSLVGLVYSLLLMLTS